MLHQLSTCFAVYNSSFNWENTSVSTAQNLNVPLASITSKSTKPSKIAYSVDTSSAHSIYMASIHFLERLSCYDIHAGQQKVKGKPFLRLICGQVSHVFEFDTEADRDMFIDTINRVSKVPLEVQN